MDWRAILARPVEEVFACLADPSRLHEWLPDVTGPPGSPPGRAEVGAALAVTIDGPGGPRDAIAELTAFEPPWLVGYRLLIGAQTLTLSVTCTRHVSRTWLRVRQFGDATPLALDFRALSL